MVALSQRTWDIACTQVFEKPEWINDPDFKTYRLEKIEPLLDNLMRARPSKHWQEKLEAAGITCALVNSVAEVVEEPQIKAREMIQETIDSKGRRLKVVASPIKLSRTPASIQRAAPLLGEHTETVLEEWLGIKKEEFDDLAKQGIFQEGKARQHWIW